MCSQKCVVALTLIMTLKLISTLEQTLNCHVFVDLPKA